MKRVEARRSLSGPDSTVAGAGSLKSGTTFPAPHNKSAACTDRDVNVCCLLTPPGGHDSTACMYRCKLPLHTLAPLLFPSLCCLLIALRMRLKGAEFW